MVIIAPRFRMRTGLRVLDERFQQQLVDGRRVVLRLLCEYSFACLHAFVTVRTACAAPTYRRRRRHLIGPAPETNHKRPATDALLSQTAFAALSVAS